MKPRYNQSTGEYEVIIYGKSHWFDEWDGAIEFIDSCEEDHYSDAPEEWLS